MACDAPARLKIGISRLLLPPGPGTRRCFTGKTLLWIEQSTAHWVMSEGALPVMVPSLRGATYRGDVTLDDYAQWLDGLVHARRRRRLAGQLRRAAAAARVGTATACATNTRSRWCKAFSAAGKPVFGICRGLQLINVAHGGTLYQDITTQKPGALRAPRRRGLRPATSTRSTSCPARAWRSCCRRAAHKINSVHHQGIKDLAPGFEVEAVSPDDGVVEAIRHDAAAPGSPPCNGIPSSTGPSSASSTTRRCCATSWRPRARPASRTMSTLAIHNPATGELITELPADDAASVAAKAARRARGAAGLGRAAAGRAQGLHRALSRRRGARPGALAAHHDARDRQADQDVAQRAQRPAAAHRLLPGRGRARRSPTETVYDEGGMREQIQHEPLGVVANISAWNYPWFVGCNVILPALLTGNAVLYKPSEYADADRPGDHAPAARGRRAAGRDGLPGRRAAKSARRCWRSRSTACSSPARTPPASASPQAVGKRFVKLQLELGGKDPTYVCDDADPKAAAESLADGAMYNTGQSCCSVERIYVHEKIHDAFVDALRRRRCAASRWATR